MKQPPSPVPPQFPSPAAPGSGVLNPGRRRSRRLTGLLALMTLGSVWMLSPAPLLERLRAAGDRQNNRPLVTEAKGDFSPDDRAITADFQSRWLAPAWGKKSGGRSSGGSFGRSGSGSGSSGSGSSGSSGSSNSTQRSSGSSGSSASTPAPSIPRPSTPRPVATATPRPTSGTITSTPRPSPTATPRATSGTITSPPRPAIVPVPIPVPIPAGRSGTSGVLLSPNAYPASATVGSNRGFPWAVLGLVAFMLGILIVAFVYAQRSSQGNRSNSGLAQGMKTGVRELDNDRVTITLLQVALLANAPQLQQNLADLATEADTSSTEGLVEELQNIALLLLRLPEYWSHVKVISESFPNREGASQRYQELSVQERRKFSAETLTNVKGRVQNRAAIAPLADEFTGDIAEYIVVTLLVGTEDDKPLFTKLYDSDSLGQALERLAAVTEAYLAIFELLWTPQAEGDNLTGDELLTEYPDMIQL